MKLELKHIVPYLPYDLTVQWLRDDDKAIILSKLGVTDYQFLIYQKNAKPILRPLSDITKNIVIEENLFRPIEILFETEYPSHIAENGKYYYEIVPNWVTCSHINTAAITKIYLNQFENNPIWMYNLLLQWHFDCFNLIPNGLAIDINTLK